MATRIGWESGLPNYAKTAACRKTIWQLSFKIMVLIIDKNAVQLLEHGHRYVRDMELYVIAKVFGVSMEDLFAGTQFDIE